MHYIFEGMSTKALEASPPAANVKFQLSKIMDTVEYPPYHKNKFIVVLNEDIHRLFTITERVIYLVRCIVL